MKPRQKRQHYARKRQRQEHPDTYCARNSTYKHKPCDALWGHLIDDDPAHRLVKFTTSCRYCGLRIECIQPLAHVGGSQWDTLPWRREEFIICEDPV